MEYFSAQAARDDKLKAARKGLTAEALTKAGWKEEDLKKFKVGKQRVTGKKKKKDDAEIEAADFEVVD